MRVAAQLNPLVILVLLLAAWATQRAHGQLLRAALDNRLTSGLLGGLGAAGSGGGGRGGGGGGAVGGLLGRWGSAIGGAASAASPPLPSPAPARPGVAVNSFASQSTASDPLGPVASARAGRPVSAVDWMSAFGARAQQGASLGVAPAAPAAGPPATLRLRNACAGATLLATAHFLDADSGAWATPALSQLPPGAVVDVGRTSNGVAYVFAAEQGAGPPCGGGGRCWSGPHGPWAPGGRGGQAYGFVKVAVPQQAMGAVKEHSFTC